jgi:hypothetical protein
MPVLTLLKLVGLQDKPYADWRADCGQIGDATSANSFG